MTLSYLAFWDTIVLSYLLGYCSGARLKQMSLANAVTVTPSIEPTEQTPDQAAHQDYRDLRRTIQERNLEWWMEELERRRTAGAMTPVSPIMSSDPLAESIEVRRIVPIGLLSPYISPGTYGALRRFRRGGNMKKSGTYGAPHLHSTPHAPRGTKQP